MMSSLVCSLEEENLRAASEEKDFPGGPVAKTLHYAGHLDSIPGSGRSPGEGNGNPRQYSCLENPMD